MRRNHVEERVKSIGVPAREGVYILFRARARFNRLYPETAETNCDCGGVKGAVSLVATNSHKFSDFTRRSTWLISFLSQLLAGNRITTCNVARSPMNSVAPKTPNIEMSESRKHDTPKSSNANFPHLGRGISKSRNLEIEDSRDPHRVTYGPDAVISPVNS